MDDEKRPVSEEEAPEQENTELPAVEAEALPRGRTLKRVLAGVLTLLLIVAAVCACRYIEPHPSGIFYRARR